MLRAVLRKQAIILQTSIRCIYCIYAVPDTESSPHGLAPESGENSILSRIKETEAKLNRLHDQKVSSLERAALTNEWMHIST